MAQRGYSLCYEIKLEGKRTENVFLTTTSLPINTARHFWQTALLTGTFAGFRMALKPTPATLDEATAQKNQATWMEVVKTHRAKGTTEVTR